MGPVLSCPPRHSDAAPHSPAAPAPVDPDAPPEGKGYWRSVGSFLPAILPVLLAKGMEDFEYALYANAMPEIKRCFFNGSSVGVWSGFLVSFVMRPIGGAVMGWYSDHYGRRKAVIITAYMMLFCTVGQALIPSTIGSAGTVLILLMRIGQGLGYGATSALVVYCVEHPPNGLRGASIAAYQLSGLGGHMAAGSMYASLSIILSPVHMSAWGWRLPYLLALLLGGYAAWKAHALPETQEFLDAQHRQQDPTADGRTKATILNLTDHIAVFIGAFAAIPMLGYTGSAFQLQWIPQNTGVGTQAARWLMVGASTTQFLLMPLVGWAVDRLEAPHVLLAGYTATSLLLYPTYFLAWHTGLPGVAVLQLFLGAVPTLGVPMTVFTSGLFPAEVRSLLFGALSNALLCATGGTTPLVLTWLCRSYVLAPAMVGTMLAGLGSVATAIAILMQRSGVQIDYHRRPDGPNAGGKRATPAEQESEATPCAVAGEGHSVKGTGQSEKTG